MVPLNPSTNDAIYSTMIYVVRQARMLGMCCTCLTFDEPLYQKAMAIKVCNQNEFAHLHLRLGGFHQLMSFM